MVAPPSWNDDGLEDFPRVEEFIDCCGHTRRFEVDLHIAETGYFLRAVEVRDAPGGYEFAAYAEDSPFLALGRLRHRIARGIATRYLVLSDGTLRLGHDRAVGHIDYGGVVIDGEPIDFDAFVAILQGYEGWQFELRIVDPYEALWGDGSV
jgi:hypothetical protein